MSFFNLLLLNLFPVKFSQKIIKWYETNKRHLPWRETNDPYKIWISEIILQQTRIEQGLDYYLKFIKHYPNIKSLAAASETEVLKLWQGLGYYTRARNLHLTAKYITEKCEGRFPRNYNEIIGLKGIGEYTAAAISSIAFDQSYPVVDGNVLRFFSRYFGIKTDIKSHETKKVIQKQAESLIDRKQPGTFNQAIMEFGALQCIPVNPKCQECIFKKDCYAFTNKMVDKLPLSINKIKQRKRHFNYLIFLRELKKGKVTYLKQRTENDIWKNLYDFPLIESKAKVTLSETMKTIEKQFDISLNHTSVTRSKEYKHILTHQIIHTRFFIIDLPKEQKVISMNSDIKNEWVEVNADTISKFPIPRLIDRYLKENNIFEG